MTDVRADKMINLLESMEDDAISEFIRQVDREDSVGVLGLARFDISTKIADGNNNPRLKNLLQHVITRLNKLRNSHQ